MANDPIVDNAAAAAATPASGPPAPVEPPGEGRRQEPPPVKQDPVARYAAERQAERDAARAAAREKMSPGERRRQELMSSPDGVYSKDATKQRAAMAELRSLLYDLADPTEQQAIAEAPLEDQRRVFGIEPPTFLPPSYVAEYEERFSSWEGDFLVAARQDGLDAALVRDLRDAGIRLGIAADGKPVTAEAWAAVQKRFAGRLTANQFDSLRRWWVSSIEGGAS